jgi:hypothetical protein
VLPALMTTGGMLIGISTPYRKIGLLHTKHRDHFGVTDDDVLIVQGPSTAFNPTLSQDKIASAIAADPDGASSEWLATFRTDIAAFLDDTMIDAAIDRDRPLELPPRTHNYLCFVDPSGGRHDAFTICIGHEEGETFVADVVRGVKPPFDPHEVAKDFAALAREYHCSEVHGDRYSAEWVAMAFENAGISYQSSEKNKSQLYLEALPLFARGAITFPDLPPLVRELRLLERQNHRGGRATVDHPTSGSDDFANVLCACAATAKGDVYDPFGPWLDGEDSRPPENVEKRKERAALTTSARPFWGMPVVGGG